MKSNLIIIIFLVLGVKFSVFSQSSYNDYQYNKTEIFTENFYNNNKYWSKGESDGDSKGSIYDGYYYWESKVSGAKTTS
jgi:hypothetical protein